MITEKQLCKALSQYNGEEVDSLQQVVKITFSGEELLEFVNSINPPKLIYDVSRFTYCVTYPPYKMIDNTTAVLNMDAYCGCGKQYKEHKEWQEWMSKNGL